MSEFTTNMNFELVNFNQITWHDEEHNNWIIADAALRALGMTGLLGIWQNSTAYAVNDRLVDPELFAIYQCAVAHTSPAAPTLFAASRAANPTFWTLISTFPVVDYLPTVDDTTSLGAAIHRFANLFLKSTGTINFGNSNYMITHAPGQLTLGGIVIASGNLSTLGTFGAAGLATLSAGLTVTGAAISLSPANFNVVISPTGTGVVTINPATLGSLNNVTLGATTPSTAKVTTLEYTNVMNSPHPMFADGRLTLESGVPVSVTDQLAKTTLYYTPYKGELISLYDGTKWVHRAFAEISITLAALTAARPHDVFIYDNAGVATIELQAWTNATTRNVAIVKQDGVWCQSGSLTRRYVGTFYCNAAGGQCDDAAAFRYVWNMYNRVRRHMAVYDPTNSWAYTTATIRQANAAATNQIDFVRGIDEENVDASVAVSMSNTAANVVVGVGIGLDSTTVFSTDGSPGYVAIAVLGNVFQMVATYRGNPGLGRHVLTWLEVSQATGTTTWYGDNNVPLLARSGIQGSMIG